MKKTYTVIRLTLLAAICLLAACADAERMEDHLSQTEETMKTDPAKALDMLDSISRQNIPTREQQARYALLYTQARYLNGYEIRSDSLINTAVSYFREHGPKQSLMKSLQAKARINLVNHDLGKAVLAATEASELAAQDSDYLWMARSEEVLAHVFRRTQKYDDCLLHSRNAAEYYKKAGREVNHWFCLTDVVDAYTMNSATYDKALALIDSIDEVATDSGVISDCMAQRMYILIDKRDYQKAEKCMQKLMSCRDNYQPGPVEHTWLAIIKHSKGDIKGATEEVRSAWAQVRDAMDKVYITRAVYEMCKAEGRYDHAVIYADTLLAYQTEATNEDFRQAVVTVQRDYYDRQAQKEGTAKERMQRLAIIVIIVCMIVIMMTAITHRFRVHVKDSLIESKMNEILLLSERLKKDDKENQDLKMQAEKSMRGRWDLVNMLCKEYFEKGDNEKLKAGIISKVDKEMERICSRKHMEEIETLVNNSMNGIVTKLRTQCPELKQEDVLFATLVYAGLAPRAVCLCTGIKPSITTPSECDWWSASTAPTHPTRNSSSASSGTTRTKTPSRCRSARKRKRSRHTHPRIHAVAAWNKHTMLPQCILRPQTNKIAREETNWFKRLVSTTENRTFASNNSNQTQSNETQNPFRNPWHHTPVRTCIRYGRRCNR